MTAPIRWTARKVGIAHAHEGARPLRTACGMDAIPETQAWPAKKRCVPCLTALGLPLTREISEMVETHDREQAIAIAKERVTKHGREVVSATARPQDWGYVVTLQVAA